MDTAANSRRRHLLVVVALLLVAFGLRAYQLRESLWLDELHTSWCVSGSWTDVAPRAKIGNQSPLYFYLPWLSVRLLGQNEIALRLPSMIAGLLLVASVYGVVAYATRNATCGALSGFLAAIDPRIVFYAQEARPYAAVELVAILHIVALWKCCQTSRTGWRAIYVISGVMLFYLHYTAALLLAADVAVFTILSLWPSRTYLGEPAGVSPRTWERKRPRANTHRLATVYSVWRWLFDIGCMVACCLFASGHLRQVFMRRRNWDEIVGPEPFVRIFQLMPLDVYVLLPIAIILIAAVVSDMRTRAGFLAEGRGLLTVTAWYLCPVGVAWILTATDVARIFSLRYLNVVIVAPVVFAGLCLGMLPSRKGRTMAALIVGGVSLWYTGYAQQLAADGRLLVDRNENWRATVQAINQAEADRDTPILLVPNLIEDREIALGHNSLIREYALFPLHGMYRVESKGTAAFPFPANADEFQITDEVRRKILEHHGTWLLVRGSPELADSIERATIHSWADSKAPLRVVSKTSYGDLTLTRLRIEP